MSRKKKANPPLRNWLPYFALCQEIGMRIQETGVGIVKGGVYAPLFHSDMVKDLERLRAFCGIAIETINKAQADWINDSKDPK